MTAPAAVNTVVKVREFHVKHQVQNPISDWSNFTGNNTLVISKIMQVAKGHIQSHVKPAHSERKLGGKRVTPFKIQSRRA